MPLATLPTKRSVSKFLNSIEDEQKRKDCKALLKIFKEITKKSPVIWGEDFMIGFGKYKYQRKGKKEKFEWFNTGFAPRKANITVYLTYYVNKDPLLKKLGKHKVGKGCLYIKRLEDIDPKILKKLITKSKDAEWFS